MWAPCFKLSPFELHGQKTSIPNRKDKNEEERKPQKCAGGCGGVGGDGGGGKTIKVRRWWRKNNRNAAGGAVGGDCIQLHYSRGFVKIKVDCRVHVGSMWWRESKKKKEVINQFSLKEWEESGVSKTFSSVWWWWWTKNNKSAGVVEEKQQKCGDGGGGGGSDCIWLHYSRRCVEIKVDCRVDVVLMQGPVGSSMWWRENKKQQERKKEVNN